MISDYLYNTPAPEQGAKVALILFASPYTDNATFSAAVHGKTLAQVQALTNVIATGVSSAQPLAFGARGKRKSTTMYGRTYSSDFDFPKSVTLTVHRNGMALGLCFALVIGDKVIRAVHMSVALTGAEAKATRVSFSPDDASYVSDIQSAGPTGTMVGNMEAKLTLSAPLSAPTPIGAEVSVAVAVGS